MALWLLVSVSLWEITHLLRSEGLKTLFCCIADRTTNRPIDWLTDWLTVDPALDFVFVLFLNMLVQCSMIVFQSIQKSLERIQRRVMRVIFPFKPYQEALAHAGWSWNSFSKKTVPNEQVFFNDFSIKHCIFDVSMATCFWQLDVFLTMTILYVLWGYLCRRLY